MPPPGALPARLPHALQLSCHAARDRLDLVYLLQRRVGGPKIFAFVAGDEMAPYRQHGLVNDKGQPA